MAKLERLTENEFGHICKGDRVLVIGKDVFSVSKTKTLRVEYPLDISEKIDKMAENSSSFIPKRANSYVASDYNPDTQHIQRNGDNTGEVYSVFAVKFYKTVLEETSGVPLKKRGFNVPLREKK